jgi:hypothetical protein
MKGSIKSNVAIIPAIINRKRGHLRPLINTPPRIKNSPNAFNGYKKIFSLPIANSKWAVMID